jgi:hypothetical protein
VTHDRESTIARRYLLDEASDEERSAVESEYFGDADARDRLEAAEDRLIEDYLDGRLDSAERSRFERNYLTAPHRRRRVDLIRALMAVAGREASVPAARPSGAMAWAPLAAAALVVLFLGGWWVLRTTPRVPDTPEQSAAAPRPTEPSAPARPAPRVFSFSISPIAVRSAGTNATRVIPADIDVVRIRLEGDVGQSRVNGARVRIRTVTGTVVWRGSAEAPVDAPAGTIAQVEVPAPRLPADDYVVELIGTEAGGAERERARYFLSVRLR